PATGLRLRADGVVVRTADGAIAAGRAWSTLPLGLLAKLAEATPEVLDAAAGLETRALVLVYLVLDTDRYTGFDAHYLPGPETPVTRLSEPKNYRDGDDPAGRTVLCAELPCALGDEHWTATEAELGALVARGLPAVGLPPVHPAAVEVRRLPHAYPIYRRGFEPAFAALDAWASSQPRLLTFGRQGLYAHDNTHHALAMARAATTALRPGGGFDPAQWATAREVFTHHIVED
ncbi:MAG: FAD-dependent oxidoreductase, partial [Acidimicrobiia bacterium]